MTTMRLHANLGVSSLAEQLLTCTNVPAIRELDLTNCILLEPGPLPLFIGTCTGLQSLRCVACPLRPSDLLGLMLGELPHLVEVEFSLVGEADVESQVTHMQHFTSQFPGALALNVRHVYVEVGASESFKLLSALLRYCPKIDDLRVHFVRGSFSYALRQCSIILQQREDLQTFTFSSEVPPSIEGLPSTPSDFISCASVCANVSYQRSSNSWSCAQLSDLALACLNPFTLPLQLVVVALHSAEGGTEHWIRVASLGNDWTNVRRLCLLLVPAEPSLGFYPVADATYRQNLREFFSAALKHIVELNISSFHFGPDLDLAEVLQDGSLKCLQALSAPLCALRRPSSLRRLAQNCLDIKELDVRIDRRDSVVRCLVCEAQCLLGPEDGAEMNITVPVFHNGLARLTLGDVHGRLCRWFIEVCPALAVRLYNCPSPSSPDYPLWGKVLASNSLLCCLVLRHDDLPFGETSLLANISCVAGLQYLCLLSAASVPDDLAEMSVLAFWDSLKPHLKCIHVHYRSSRCDTEKRITWMRRLDDPSGGVLVRDGPCFLYCSTATFIGLSKPLNRDFKPIM